MNSAKALKGLELLVNGFRQGWIPRITLSYEEESAQNGFASGKFLFMDNWPDVYQPCPRRDRRTRCTGSSGSRRCPG